MTRAFNFCAGPAAFPAEVLKELQEETLDYKNHGLAVMEMSHRSKEFVSIAEQAKQDFIDLLSIPDEYDVLFIQGGASLQFSMIPMNLGNKNQKLDYLEVGSWSKKAIAEAKKFHDVNIAASSKDISFKKTTIVANHDQLVKFLFPKKSFDAFVPVYFNDNKLSSYVEIKKKKLLK